MDWCILPEAGLFTSDLRYISPQSADPWYFSAVWCLLLYVMVILYLQIFVLINIGNLILFISLTASEICDRKYQEITDLEFVRKTMIPDILI